MSKPIASKTPKQIYDLVRQRESTIRLLPDGELKEKVRVDLARLRTYAETLHAVRKAASRKSFKR